MLGRWFVYLASLAGCIVFYCAYREWFSWLALMGVLALPWFSLLLSLPALLSVRGTLRCPLQLQQGGRTEVQLQLRCRFPVPRAVWQLQSVSRMTGKKKNYKHAATLDTAHCGTYDIRVRHLRICDYLGLFCVPLRATGIAVTVFPQKRPVSPAPELAQCRPKRWKPKAGGGFSENHDLRLYRPGDSLRQIHWKLAAKTGKLIYREPIEPVQNKNVLTMVLSGSGAQLDEKLGTLSWMMEYLLEEGIPHEVRCMTGEGLLTLPVTDAQQAESVLKRLLGCPVAPAGTVMAPLMGVGWQYRIGGGLDEA